MYHHEILINNKVYNLLDRPFNFKAMESFSHEKQKSDFFIWKTIILSSNLTNISRWNMKGKSIEFIFSCYFLFQKKNTRSLLEL